MSTIVSLLLSIIISITAVVSGSVPGNNPKSVVKPIGPTVSATAAQNNQSNSNSDSGNQGLGKPEGNFGAWVSSLAPEEPRADGAAFGEKVSTAAKENGGQASQYVPPVEPPVEPPIGTRIIKIPCDNWNNDIIILPSKPMWGEFCLL